MYDIQYAVKQLLYITNKIECFSFKSEHAVWVAKLKKIRPAYSVIVRILGVAFITKV